MKFKYYNLGQIHEGMEGTTKLHRQVAQALMTPMQAALS